jgi:hypothetical protein
LGDGTANQAPANVVVGWPTVSAEEMLNEKNKSESYNDLLEAMRILYEHALKTA